MYLRAVRTATAETSFNHELSGSFSVTLDLNVAMDGGRERCLCCQMGPWSPEDGVAESAPLCGRVSLAEKAAMLSQTLNTPIYLTRKMAIRSMSFGGFGGHATVEKWFKNQPFQLFLPHLVFKWYSVTPQLALQT